MVLSITDSLGTVEKLTLEGESISGATISSPYVDFIFEPRIINSVGINTTTDGPDVYSGDITGVSAIRYDAYYS
jgi:hypothetical protein